MIRFPLIILAIIVSVALLLPAHVNEGAKITWSRDVSRIVYKNCASCHREGGSAASLLTYEQARGQLESIRTQVCSRRMPPWNAVKGFGEFRNNPSLSQEEIEIIAEWIAEGAQEGDRAYLPPAPDFHPQTGEANLEGTRIVISGTKLMKQAVTALGIEPQRLPDADMQVIVRQPDGSVEPLIWVKKFNSTYTGIYYFRDPLHLTAGTRVEVIPPSGAIALLVAGPQRLSSRK